MMPLRLPSLKIDAAPTGTQGRPEFLGRNAAELLAVPDFRSLLKDTGDGLPVRVERGSDLSVPVSTGGEIGLPQLEEVSARLPERQTDGRGSMDWADEPEVLHCTPGHELSSCPNMAKPQLHEITLKPEEVAGRPLVEEVALPNPTANYSMAAHAEPAEQEQAGREIEPDEIREIEPMRDIKPMEVRERRGGAASTDVEPPELTVEPEHMPQPPHQPAADIIARLTVLQPPAAHASPSRAGAPSDRIAAILGTPHRHAVAWADRTSDRAPPNSSEWPAGGTGAANELRNDGLRPDRAIKEYQPVAEVARQIMATAARPISREEGTVVSNPITSFEVISISTYAPAPQPLLVTQTRPQAAGLSFALPPAVVTTLDRVIAPGATKVLTLRLEPAHLGEVTVTMRLRQGALDVRLEAQSRHTLELVRRDEMVIKRVMEQAGFDAGDVTLVFARPASETNQAAPLHNASGQTSRPGAQAGEGSSPSGGQGGHAGREHAGTQGNRSGNHETREFADPVLRRDGGIYL